MATMTDAAVSKTFRQNVRWQIVGSVSQAILSGALLLLIGRQLGASGFGVFSIVMGYVYLANSLLEPRIQDVAAKRFWDITAGVATNDRHGSDFIDLFVFEAVVKLVPCVALLMLAPLLARAGNLPSGAAFLIIVAAIGIYVSRLGGGLSTGLLRVLGRSDLNTFCATGELLLRLTITVVLVWRSELTPFACVAVVCVAGIASNSMQLLFAATQVGELDGSWSTWKASHAVTRLRESRRFLLSNIGLSLSDLMNKDLDVTLASMMMPPDRVGIYKMAKNITMLTWRAVDPFSLALMPEVNRLVRIGSKDSLRRLLWRSGTGLLALAASVSALAFALLLLFGNAVLGVAFADVQTLIPWMLVGIVGSAPLVWGHPLAVALNRADIALTGSMFGASVGIVAFVLLVPVAGLWGAGAAWSLTSLCNYILTSRMAYGQLRKSDLRSQAHG